MICMLVHNLVAIGRTIEELLQIIDFQYGGLRRLGFVVRMREATHEVHYMVFITVQNLVGIG